MEIGWKVNQIAKIKVLSALDRALYQMWKREIDLGQQQQHFILYFCQ